MGDGEVRALKIDIQATDCLIRELPVDFLQDLYETAEQTMLGMVPHSFVNSLKHTRNEMFETGGKVNWVHYLRP